MAVGKNLHLYLFLHLKLNQHLSLHLLITKLSILTPNPHFLTTCTLTHLQVQQDGTVLPATELKQWCELVEEVIPRQSYLGRNKAFSLDNQVRKG